MKFTFFFKVLSIFLMNFSLVKAIEITCIDASPDGKYLAIGTKEGSLYLFNRSTKAVQKKIAACKTWLTHKISKISFSPNSKYFAIKTSKNKLKLFDTLFQEKLYNTPLHDIKDFCFDQDNNLHFLKQNNDSTSSSVTQFDYIEKKEEGILSLNKNIIALSTMKTAEEGLTYLLLSPTEVYKCNEESERHKRLKFEAQAKSPWNRGRAIAYNKNLGVIQITLSSSSVILCNKSRLEILAVIEVNHPLASGWNSSMKENNLFLSTSQSLINNYEVLRQDDCFTPKRKIVPLNSTQLGNKEVASAFCSHQNSSGSIELFFATQSSNTIFKITKEVAGFNENEITQAVLTLNE